MEYQPGMKAGRVHCVGWQVTLCDPVWRVMPRNSEVEFREELYKLFSYIALSLTS